MLSLSSGELLICGNTRTTGCHWLTYDKVSCGFRIRKSAFNVCVFASFDAAGDSHKSVLPKSLVRSAERFRRVPVLANLVYELIVRCVFSHRTISIGGVPLAASKESEYSRRKMQCSVVDYSCDDDNVIYNCFEMFYHRYIYMCVSWVFLPK